MDIEFVTVGTELLLGFTHDTNAAVFARSLAPVGARVVRRATVADDPDSIRAAVSDALNRTGFAVVSGGLGPTTDDITRESVAEELGLELSIDQTVLSDIEARFARLHRGPMPESNRKQAQVPEGAEVLANAFGTAPGLWIATDRGTVVLLPGVPREFRALTEEHLVPRLAALADSEIVIVSRTLRTTGVSESSLTDNLGEHLLTISHVEVAFLPSLDGVDIRLTATGAHDFVARALDGAETALRPVLGQQLYGINDADLAALVLAELRARGARLAVAESCTGGLIAARLTEVPGSSDVFTGGVVTYADEAKIHDLGVDPDELARAGAVSDEVARAMVQGVVDRYDANAGIAVTGIAGPTGGSEEKPVGTVYLACAWNGAIEVVKRHIPGTRHEVRRRAVQAALDLLRRML